MKSQTIKGQRQYIERLRQHQERIAEKIYATEYYNLFEEHVNIAKTIDRQKNKYYTK